MACPKCGCKTTYLYDEGDDLPGGDERLQRCAACGAVFDLEDEAPEDEEPAEALAIFQCGPRPTCPDGTDHDYSKWVEIVDAATGCGGGSAVCVKCGHRAIDDAMWM